MENILYISEDEFDIKNVKIEYNIDKINIKYNYYLDKYDDLCIVTRYSNISRYHYNKDNIYINCQIKLRYYNRIIKIIQQIIELSKNKLKNNFNLDISNLKLIKYNPWFNLGVSTKLINNLFLDFYDNNQQNIKINTADELHDILHDSGKLRNNVQVKMIIKPIIFIKNIQEDFNNYITTPFLSIKSLYTEYKYYGFIRESSIKKNTIKEYYNMFNEDDPFKLII